MNPEDKNLNSVETDIQNVVSESPVYDEQRRDDAFKALDKSIETEYASQPVVSIGNQEYIGTNETYNEVTPFKLSIFDNEIKATTANPRQIAYDFMVASRGYPRENYLGYSYSPFHTKEGAISNFIHGVQGMFGQIPAMLASGADLVGDLAMKPAEAWNAATGLGSEFVALGHQISQNNYENGQRWSEQLSDVFDLYTEDDSLRTKFWRGMGSGITALGAMIASRDPKIASILLNVMSYDNIKHSALDNGATLDESQGRALGGFALIAALDAVSGAQLINSMKGIVVRQSARNMKQMAREVALGKETATNAYLRGLVSGLGSAAEEGGTEWLQDDVEDIAGGAAGLDEYQNFFTDDKLASLLTGFVLGLSAVPGSVRKAVVEKKFAELANYKTNTAVADTISFMNAAKDYLVERGMFTEEQANDFLARTAQYSPEELLSELNTAVKEQFAMGLKDPSEATEFMKAVDRIIKNNTDVSEAAWQEIDQAVEDSIYEIDDEGKRVPIFGYSESDVLRLKGIFRGIASWALLKTGMSPADFAKKYVPNFKVSEKLSGSSSLTSFAVNPNESSMIGTNVLENNAVSPEYTSYITDESAIDKSISVRTNTILHEAIHQLGRFFIAEGVDPKEIQDFMDLSFRGITALFGEEKAKAVKESSNRAMGFDLVKKEDYTKNENTTEWMAQAGGAIGKASLELLGLKGKTFDFLGFMHQVLGGINELTSLPPALDAYIKSVKALSKNHGTRLAEMAKQYGVDNLSSAVQQVIDMDNVDINWKGINADVIKELYDMSKSFTDGRGAEIMQHIFETPEKAGKLVNVAERYWETADELSEIYSNMLSQIEPLVKKDNEILSQIMSLSESLNNKKLSKKKREEIENQIQDLRQQGLDTDAEIETIVENAQNTERETASQSSYDDLFSDNTAIATSDYMLEYTNKNSAPTQVEQNLLELEKEKKSAEEGDSMFNRQIHRKIGGVTLEKSMSNAEKYVTEAEKNKKHSKIYKFFIGLPSHFGIDEMPWAIGGQKLMDDFDLLHKHEVFDNLVLEYHDALNARVLKELFSKELKAGTASKDLIAFENNCAVKKYDIKYRDPLTKNVVDRKLNTFEVMMVYNVGKQDKPSVDEDGNVIGPSPKQRLQDSIVDTTIDELVKKLSPEEKKYADIMQKMLGEAYERIRKSYEAQGIKVDAGYIENYWMLLDATHQELGDDYTISTISRDEFAKSPLGIFDVREQFNRYMARAAGVESEFYGAIHRLQDLFFFKPNREGVMTPQDEAKAAKMTEQSHRLYALAKERIGEKGMANFKALLDDFLTNREKNLLNDSIVSKFSRNITTAILSWKPRQFVKNTSNFFSFWGLAPDQGKYWKDTVAGLMDPVKTWKFMVENSEVVRKRMRGQSYSEFLNAQTAGGDNIAAILFKQGSNKFLFKNGRASALNNYLALSQVLKSMGLSPMIYGDAMANIYGGYALFKQYLDMYNGDVKLAGKAFDAAVLRRQASSNQTLKSLYQRQLNRTVAGNALAFVSEGVQKWNDIIHNLEAGQQGEKSGKDVTKSVASTVSAMIAFSLISAGMIDLFFGDDEERDEAEKAFYIEMLNSVLGMSIFSNSVVTPIAYTMIGQATRGANIPFTNAFVEVARDFNSLDLDKMAVQMASISGLFVGLPNLLNEFQGGVRVVSGKTSAERQAGARQVMGYTRSTANKREGIKEKPLTKDEE